MENFLAKYIHLLLEVNKDYTNKWNITDFQEMPYGAQFNFKTEILDGRVQILKNLETGKYDLTYFDSNGSPNEYDHDVEMRYLIFHIESVICYRLETDTGSFENQIIEQALYFCNHILE